jgi:transposase
VHVVGLAGELEQLALDVHAHGLHALFRPREVPVGEQVVPVGRHEHHVHMHAETAVATGAKAVPVLAKALTAAKRTPQRAWLAEVSAVVLQQALADANAAYRGFFASVTGERTGRKLGAPRFRSKRDRARSIRFTKAARFRVLPNGRLRLPGIGDVPVRWSHELPGVPSSVTVTVDATGRYHTSFVVDVPDQPLPPVDARAAGTRRDWLHKLSTTVVRENQLIAVEDLAVSGPARTRPARSVVSTA